MEARTPHQLRSEHSLSFKLFAILILGSVIQQFPPIRDQFYGEFRLGLYAGFAILLALSIARGNIPYVGSLFLWPLVTIFLFCVLALAAGILTAKIDLDTVVLHLIPAGILMTSMATLVSPDSVVRLLRLYAVFALAMGLSTVAADVGGLVLEENYLVLSKNQVGPMVGLAVCFSLVRAFHPRSAQSKLSRARVMEIVIILGLIMCLIVIRNRSGLVGVTIILLILALKKFRRATAEMRIKVSALACAIFIVGAVTGLLSTLSTLLWESFTGNYEVSDLNSLSAGRWDRLGLAGAFFADNPLLGELGGTDVLGVEPHVYILSILTSYGLLVGAPLLFLYLFLWRWSIRSVNRSDDFTVVQKFACYGLLFALVVSLFEYSAPFGPGVTFLTVWFLLGQVARSYP